MRVLAYYHCPQTNEITGVVHFGPEAESHRGLCHGGAMTSLMDDVCGHIAFLYEGQAPWGGATVQVDVSLKKPVRVGQVLRVVGRVVSFERRKMRIEATLDDGGGADSTVYAELRGLSIAGVRLSADEAHEGDVIATRTWEKVLARESEARGVPRLVRQDSSWKTG